jgi:hypothetical protein
MSKILKQSLEYINSTSRKSALNESKVSKEGVSIGNRLLVFKVGRDTNGNWSYWVNSIRGSNDGARPKKIQHTDAMGKLDKITDVRDFAKNKKASAELAKYAMKHLKLSGLKEEKKSISESSTNEKVHKAMMKKYGNDPYYKKVIDAILSKDKSDMEKSIKSLISVRGAQSFKNLQSDIKSMLGESIDIKEEKDKRIKGDVKKVDHEDDQESEMEPGKKKKFDKKGQSFVVDQDFEDDAYLTTIDGILKQARGAIDNHMSESAPLEESAKNFTDMGIPVRVAKVILRQYSLDNNASAEIVSKPKQKDVLPGQVYVHILPNGEDSIIVGIGMDGFSRYYHSIRITGNKIEKDVGGNLGKMTKGMKAKGTTFVFRTSKLDLMRSNARGNKRSTDISDNVYAVYRYMNDVFHPKIGKMLDKMVDEIYMNLRKLSSQRTNSISSRSEQEIAIQAAGAIENIAKQKFNSRTMKEFLVTMKRASHGFGETPRNEEELLRVLMDTPNAKAKWARSIVKVAEYHLDKVRKMVADK